MNQKNQINQIKNQESIEDLITKQENFKIRDAKFNRNGFSAIDTINIQFNRSSKIYKKFLADYARIYDKQLNLNFEKADLYAELL